MLFDEILEYIVKSRGVTYADTSLGAQTLSFFNELTEVVASLKNGMMIVTLPSSLLEDFGDAHQQNLAQLEERIMSLAVDQLGHLDLSPEIVIDAELPLSAFTGETFNLMQKLSPFGRGNPEPTFLTRQVEVIEYRNFGNQGKWLRLKLKQGIITWQAVDFGSQRAGEEIPSYVDIVYNLEKSRWNGEEVLGLNLRDFAPIQLR